MLRSLHLPLLAPVLKPLHASGALTVEAGVIAARPHALLPDGSIAGLAPPPPPLPRATFAPTTQTPGVILRHDDGAVY